MASKTISVEENRSCEAVEIAISLFCNAWGKTKLALKRISCLWAFAKLKILFFCFRLSRAARTKLFCAWEKRFFENCFICPDKLVFSYVLKAKYFISKEEFEFIKKKEKKIKKIG